MSLQVELKQPADMTGSHVGETAQKTAALIELCRGKVLLIDEAYALNDGTFGKEALDTLVSKATLRCELYIFNFRIFKLMSSTVLNWCVGRSTMLPATTSAWSCVATKSRSRRCSWTKTRACSGVSPSRRPFSSKTSPMPSFAKSWSEQFDSNKSLLLWPRYAAWACGPKSSSTHTFSFRISLTSAPDRRRWTARKRTS